jgi:hypothetical protein
MKTKILLLLIILPFIKCKSIKENKKNFIDVLSKRIYGFSDNGIRNIRIRFLNDSVLEVKNFVTESHAESYYLYNFNIKYRIKNINYFQHKVVDILTPTEDFIYSSSYIHPYRRGLFRKKTDIFPVITNDTIFFNEDFTKFLIKDFTFDMEK